MKVRRRAIVLEEEPDGHTATTAYGAQRSRWTATSSSATTALRPAAVSLTKVAGSNGG
jgi:hypothetical protein